MTLHTDLVPIRAEFRATLAALDAALDDHRARGAGVIDARAFVVVDEFGAMLFDASSGGCFSRRVGYAPAHLATRLSRPDADRLARATNGTARHWTDAARAQADRLRKSLGILETLPCA